MGKINRPVIPLALVDDKELRAEAMLEEAIASAELTEAFEPPKHLTNTRQMSICPHCNCMAFILMDNDGNRFCGKCKQPKPKGGV